MDLTSLALGHLRILKPSYAGESLLKRTNVGITALIVAYRGDT